MKRIITFICLLLILLSITTAASAASKKDTKAPVITKTNPVDYDTNVMVDGSILIRFSEGIQKSTNIAKISLKESDLKKVTFTYEINDKFIVIKPKTNLKYDTIYTVSIPSAAVKDSSGNKLTKAYVFSFITEQDPAKAVTGDEAEDYNYIVELEVHMDDELTETKTEYYTQLLKYLGIDAEFKNVKEVKPKATPKVTPKLTPKVTPEITPAIP